MNENTYLVVDEYGYCAYKNMGRGDALEIREADIVVHLLTGKVIKNRWGSTQEQKEPYSDLYRLVNRGNLQISLVGPGKYCVKFNTSHLVSQENDTTVSLVGYGKTIEKAIDSIHEHARQLWLESQEKSKKMHDWFVSLTGQKK